MALQKIEGEVWCDVHGCIHEKTTDPYDYGYAVTGQEPECQPSDWRRLWMGARIGKPMPEKKCYTGEHCSVCGEPQFDTPSGVTCSNGHGGAPSKEDQ